VEDFRKTVAGRPYISVGKDKTDAGIRKVPIPVVLWQQLKDYLDQHGSFGFYVREDGGGASDVKVSAKAIFGKDCPVCYYAGNESDETFLTASPHRNFNLRGMLARQ
jgi:hypothetical protein